MTAEHKRGQTRLEQQVIDYEAAAEETARDRALAKEKTPLLAKRLNDFIESKLPLTLEPSELEDRNPPAMKGPRDIRLECFIPTEVEGEGLTVFVMRQLVGPGRPEYSIKFPVMDRFYVIRSNSGSVETAKHRNMVDERDIPRDFPVTDSRFCGPQESVPFGTDEVDMLTEFADTLNTREDIQIMGVPAPVPEKRQARDSGLTPIV